ncbi:thioredoxin family protein [Lentzea sp. NPDC034063]|uniref:thioredoxin family protein n=1 Tax=unclassified Lentzea TaxID=2643253 RepID=UPI0033C4BE79
MRHDSSPLPTLARREHLWYDLAESHGLRALPTIVLYRDGRPARRFAGAISAEDLAEAADDLAATDMQEEYDAWMVETSEAGSPHIGTHG